MIPLLLDTFSRPRAVVAGGAGFVGVRLVERLVDEGLSVLVVDDLRSGHLDDLKSARGRGEVQVHQLDVRDELLPAVVARFSPAVLFHLASETRPEVVRNEPAAASSVNVAGTVNVIESARSAGVDRVVYATSAPDLFTPGRKVPVPSGATPRPASLAGADGIGALAHLAYAHRTHGLEYVACGLATVYGPGQRPQGDGSPVANMVRAILDGERPTVAASGGRSWDLVFVEDAADALVRAAVRGGNRYVHVASGHPTLEAELAERLLTLVESRRKPRLDTDAAEFPAVAFDPSGAQRQLGWEAWTSLHDGLLATVEWAKTL